MPDISVPDLPDDVYQGAQRPAHAKGRPLSGYVLTLLEHAIADDATRPDEAARRRSAEALARIRSRRRVLPPGAPDVVTLLRRMRGYGD